MILLLRLLLLFLLIYILWKFIKPYLPRIQNRPEIHTRRRTHSNIQIDKSQIEDADFREIDDNHTSKPES